MTTRLLAYGSRAAAGAFAFYLATFIGGCTSPKASSTVTRYPTPTLEEQNQQLRSEREELLAVIRALEPESFEKVGLYRVRPGDTGVKIAASHNLTMADLQALNPGVDWRKLKVWQVLRVKQKEEERQPNQALQTTSVTRSGFGKVQVSDRQRRGV